MTDTFYTQTDITASNSSVLIETNTDALVQKLSSLEMEDTVSSMRKVRNLAPDSYNYLKRKLPYFIGAKFTGDIRNSRNFESISHFVIDIDHYGDITKVEELKKKIAEDSRLFLAFVSPSGDGLKLVYSLSSKITSLKIYSDFYKSFSQRLAKQYDIEKCVDFKTSDATRICFLSYDDNAYINRERVLVNPELFISDFDLFNKPDTNEGDEASGDEKPKINNSQYKDILSKLNPKTPKREKQYIVPEVLYTVSEKLKKEFNNNGLMIDSIADINYGRKITVKDKNAFAVFNIYYGKNGFSIVKMPVRNSNPQLLDVCVAICEHVIYAEQEYKPTLDKAEYETNMNNNFLTQGNDYLMRTSSDQNIKLLEDEKKPEKSAHQNDRSDEENKKGRIIRFKAVGS